MRPLRYTINVTLDGCVDHRALAANADMHEHATESIARADALILGRVTYGLMADAWRAPDIGAMPEWMQPFARTMDHAKKYLVSTTIDEVGWNTELLRGDLTTAITALKAMPGRGLYVGGVTLPTELARLGLIDEFEFLVHPSVIGRGRRLFDGLDQPFQLQLTGRREYPSGAVALRYEPIR